MEIVSLKKSSPAKNSKYKKSLSITQKDLAFVQKVGKEEHDAAVRALIGLGTAMDRSILYKGVADKVVREMVKFLDSKLAMLNPVMSENFSAKQQELAKGEQRKLFLEYAKAYHLEGIKEE